MTNFSKNNPLIIGIDPGTRVTGYGVIRVLPHGFEAIDFGVIRSSATQTVPLRNRRMFEGVSELLDRFSPSALSVETQYVHKNVSSALTLGMTRGVCLLAATLRDIAVFEYAPMTAKKAVTGRGNASKEQVQGMIRYLLALSQIPEPQDASDALSLAICHANHMKRSALYV